MAPNGRSNLHVDAYQTDANQGPGPLGHKLAVVASAQGGDRGSVTFDSAGRIVTVCVGLAGPTYKLLDARTLEARATLALPPRQSLGGNIFQDFAGGGYFYLDHRDRAVIPTTTRHIWVVHEGRLERDFDLTAAVPRRQDHLRAARLERSHLVRLNRRRGGHARTGHRQRQVHGHPRGHRQLLCRGDEGGMYIVTNRASYGVSPPCRRRSRLQQQLRAGHAGPGRIGLRRRDQRAREVQ
jgi:hypothetical protein